MSSRRSMVWRVVYGLSGSGACSALWFPSSDVLHGNCETETTVSDVQVNLSWSEIPTVNYTYFLGPRCLSSRVVTGRAGMLQKPATCTP